MRGFSILEVLVAFVILALVGTALFRLFSGALTNIAVAEDYSRAVLVADSVLAEAAGTLPLREGSQSGTADEGRIYWSTRIAFYTPPSSPIPRHGKPVRVDDDQALANHCRSDVHRAERQAPNDYACNRSSRREGVAMMPDRCRRRRRVGVACAEKHGYVCGARSRTRLHAARVDGCAAAAGDDVGGDVRLAVVCGSELGWRRDEGGPSERDAADRGIPALAALIGVPASRQEDRRVPAAFCRRA